MTQAQAKPELGSSAAQPAAPEGRSQKAGRIARAIVSRYAVLAAVGAFLGGASPLVARAHFLLELGTHFMALYTIAAAVAFVILAVLRAWRFAAVALTALVLTGGQVAPYFGASATATATVGTRLRVMEVNVLTSNRNHDAFLEMVRAEQPDVIAVLEISAAWVEVLRELSDLYPHKWVEPQEDNFGIGLLSKLPLQDSEVIDFEGVPAIRAEVEVEGTPVHVFAVHTLPPVNSENAARRNRQLKRLPELVKDVDGSVIVVGDLNATMWSPYFKSLCRDSGLKDVRKGRGIVPSWPTQFAPVMIPIDHGLHSESLAVTGIHRGTAFGSDHLPLVVDFIVPRNSENPAAPAAAA
ncbi:MAG: endonuclease/exonuclease/phosphatase family protein [Candidatus Hydrogenedentes bacterium]|nr:endonuclease/exonuclease/phosphatase family protein [Candidatus Hydrogenedentota bacterium]